MKRTTVWPTLAKEEMPKPTPQSQLIHESYLIMRQPNVTIHEVYNAIVEGMNSKLRDAHFKYNSLRFQYIQSEVDLQERNVGGAFFFVLEGGNLNGMYGVSYFVDSMSGVGIIGASRGAGLEMLLTQGISMLPQELQQILSRNVAQQDNPHIQDNPYIIMAKSSSETGLRDPHIPLDKVLVEVGEHVLDHLYRRNPESRALLLHGFNREYETEIVRTIRLHSR